MKILFVYKSYYPDSRGGVEEILRILMAGLAQQGHKCTLLVTTPQKNAYFRQEGLVDIHYCPEQINIASCPLSIQFLFKFHELSQSHDIILFQFPWPFADFSAFLLRIKKPYIVTYQSDIVKQKYLKVFYTPLMHWFLRRATSIIATSDQYQQTSPILAHYPSKTTVIPLGLEEGLAESQFSQQKIEWHTRVGQDFFLFIGVLRYYKGLKYLLEAVENTTLPIVIAGSGPEETALKTMAEQKKLSNVVFVGAISEQDKAALLALCKAVVIPASERSEAYCLSLVEGLRAGKPLISTELGTGTSFVNKADVTGLVVPAKNAPALREALLTLAQQDDLCAKFALNARERFTHYFGSDTMIEAYSKVFFAITRPRT